MKYLTIIFLTITCKWVDIPVSDIKTEYVGHVMIGDYEKLEYEGSCGGTAGIEAHFDRIQYCECSGLKILDRNLRAVKFLNDEKKKKNPISRL